MKLDEAVRKCPGLGDSKWKQMFNSKRLCCVWMKINVDFDDMRIHGGCEQDGCLGQRLPRTQEFFVTVCRVQITSSSLKDDLVLQEPVWKARRT